MNKVTRITTGYTYSLLSTVQPCMLNTTKDNGTQNGWQEHKIPQKGTMHLLKEENNQADLDHMKMDERQILGKENHRNKGIQ